MTWTNLGRHADDGGATDDGDDGQAASLGCTPRREQHRQGNIGSEPGSVLDRGDLVLDSGEHLCTCQGKPVPLTVTEFLLVQALAQRPGHVKSRNQLIDAAYGEHIYVDDRTIDSHVKRVRRKFKEIDPAFNQIETLYGAGYRYKEA